MRSRLTSQSFVGRNRRPTSPHGGARRADMTQKGFIWLVAGWCTALVLILAVSAFIRFVG